MRTVIEKLIYRKWFYALLALILWFDSWTDLADLLEHYTARELVSLALSLAGASLLTLVFVDLHLRWPPERH